VRVASGSSSRRRKYQTKNAAWRRKSIILYQAKSALAARWRQWRRHENGMANNVKHRRKASTAPGDVCDRAVVTVAATVCG